MGFINVTYEPPEQEEVTTWETPQMEVWDVDDTPIIEYPPIPTLPPEDPCGVLTGMLLLSLVHTTITQEIPKVFTSRVSVLL